MEFRVVADRVISSKSQGFESNVKNPTIQSNVERRATYGYGSQRAGAGWGVMPDGLAYSEANNSLPGYCSVNPRNNFCASGSRFCRRAPRAITILSICFGLRLVSA